MGKAINALKVKDLKKIRRPSSFAVLSCSQGASIKGPQYIASREAKLAPRRHPKHLRPDAHPSGR